jgi:hypothetical protein
MAVVDRGLKEVAVYPDIPPIYHPGIMSSKTTLEVPGAYLLLSHAMKSGDMA